MVDEFEESEVIFEETHKKITNNEVCDFEGYSEPELEMPKKKKLRMTTNCKKKSSNISVPIKIPEINNHHVMNGGGRPSSSTWFKLKMAYDDDDDDEDKGGGGGLIQPPHLIIGRRRIAGEMTAFSVCSGNGRTLKGRDLRQFRNSILRLTGYLES